MEQPFKQITPETTLRELVEVSAEYVAFEVLFQVLADLRNGNRIIINGTCQNSFLIERIDWLKHLGCPMDAFQPDWLDRVQDVVLTIAKERGYEPKTHD